MNRAKKSSPAKRLWLAAAVFGSAGVAFGEPVEEPPIPEPAYDETGDYIWWDGAHSMTFYQLGKVADLGDSLQTAGEWSGVAPPREAANLDEVDEVADSSWFTNRHGRRRMTAEELDRGPNAGPPPAPSGALTVVSGKRLGATPGFVIEDASGRRFVLKFDPPAAPELATGAEIVSSRILHALGWNVPEYHLFTLDSSRLVLAPDAWTRGKHKEKRAMSHADLEAILSRAARLPDGRFRAVASTFVPGVPKGPFRTEGVRPDDANDVIPHEDRRELRGLRVVAAWINYTDARRGNFYDTFVRRPGDPPGHGVLLHYLLDFSSSLGSGNVEWKDPKLGHEYFLDPATILTSLVTLGLWVKPWEDPMLAHCSLGYFEAAAFDPRRWRPSYPQPLFDRMTARDARWGARLVRSFTDEDLRVVVAAGRWSDPEAEEALYRILRARREKILEAYRDDGVQVAAVGAGAGR